MKEDATNEFARNFLSVIAGVMAAIAVGALLIPVLESVFDRFFNIYLFTEPPADAWKSDLLLEITLFAWLFIASLAGGVVCTLISNKDIMNILISSLVSLTLVFIISKGDVLKKNDILPSLLILLGIPLGNLVGGWIGGRLKRKNINQSQIK